MNFPKEMDHSDSWVKAQQYWDQAADSFDEQPDHGLHAGPLLQAWTGLLKDWLPSGSSRVLDVGCGTGSLSVVLAGLGHQVTAIDLSPRMLAQAQAKAVQAGYSIEFQVMNAAAPCYAPASFETLVCRHLLWALAEPQQVLCRWAGLLKPGGRLILIEGFWSTGAGLHADELLAALPNSVKVFSHQNLGALPDLWGKSVTDERYAIVAMRG